ncbi:MAG: DUF362 domain-containing protein [Dehalococcoidales bacterium]|nr:MAG: DUF362 domain-containing protein [Dehalococcoidales bacterium]
MKVALTTGDKRSENIRDALDLIKDDIDLTGKKDVFIKVNFVDTEIQTAATHVDAVRPLLEFIRSRYEGKISIGEQTKMGPVRDAFEHYGYIDLLTQYNVNIVDMKEGNWEIIHLYDSNLQQMDIHFSSEMLKSDYLIAIGPPKTHDTATVTASIKNVVMGGVSHKHDEKTKIHQGSHGMSLDLYLMAKEHVPELAVLDGFVAMEGDGPVHGDPVDWKIAIASCDAVAADIYAADLMGFDLLQVGHLWYLQKMGYGEGDIQKMEIVGENPDDHRRKFKPHPWYDWQINWQDERVANLLGIEY